ncbi:MAG: serine/threonine-protein kinase [Planctomycetota bacterium]
MSERPPLDPDGLRSRWAADVAAGKTVVLPREALADATLRQRLPDLLEELRQQQPTAIPPLQIPGYTLLGEIGHGGMSTVWLARQHTLARHVAMKIAPRWRGGDVRAHERLLHEARAMARLSHPNIVAIHDVLEAGDVVAIAMDWIDGVTLADLIRALPPAPGADDMRIVRTALGCPEDQPLASTAVQFFAGIARDIASALQRVHEAGLLHLDVKPSNILVRRDGVPLLADFGVVRERDLLASHTRTFAGTPVYAAPEQLRRADAEFGPPTDVYGLGITLYEALARSQPLHQLGLTRMVRDVLGGRIPALGARTSVPPDLANIVHKAIAPEPHHRYPTAQALAGDVAAFLEHRPVTARPLTRVQRLLRQARREPWQAAVAGVLAVLLPLSLGLALVLWRQLPAVGEVALANQRAQANRLKQTAYQAYFGGRGAAGVASRTLAAAMDLDPEGTSLACLLAMAHEEGDPGISGLLATNVVTIAAHTGLTMLRTKQDQRRAFFTADEVARLRDSRDVVDRYVLALDRVFWAEDRRHEEGYAEADACLDQATMAVDGDPLLYGLRAWVALRAGRPDAFAAVANVLRSRWPGDVDALTWLYLALEPIDRPAALAIAGEIAQIDGRHPRSAELRAGEALRRGDAAAAIEVVEATRTAGTGSPHLTVINLLATASRDGAAAAERALRVIPADELTFARRLRLLRQCDPAAAEALIDTTLATGPQPPSVLRAAFDDASRREQGPRADQIWETWRKTWPDRVDLHPRRFAQLAARGDVPGAAALAREMVLPRQNLDTHATTVCAYLTSVRDWPTLATWADRWVEHAGDGKRQEAAAYAGIAASRLRRYEQAARGLAVATSRAVPGARWYAYTLLEAAWLRVDPDAGAALHNPEGAQQFVARFDALVAQDPKLVVGPWTWLVRAEVAFANGDRAGAIAAAERGAALRRLEPQAPADTLDRLQEALRRFRQ